MSRRKTAHTNFTSNNMASTNPIHHEFVGLNPSGSQEEDATPAPPLPKPRIRVYIQVALCLVSIRIIYAVSKVLASLSLFLFLAVAAYQFNAHTNQAVHNHDARFHGSSSTNRNTSMNMDRINREREESEAMVAEAARMMLEINRRHLEEFIITHPDASYEQWIGNLHPENVTTIDGQKTNIPTIDHRFYVEDSDHRILWNELIGEEREYVAARSSLQKDVETGN